MPALEGGQAALDRAAAPRSRFLPRTAQIGVRSVTPPQAAQRSPPSLQIALAVGTLLAVLALVNSVTTTTNARLERARTSTSSLDTVVGKQLDARRRPR